MSKIDGNVAVNKKKEEFIASNYESRRIVLDFMYGFPIKYYYGKFRGFCLSFR